MKIKVLTFLPEAKTTYLNIPVVLKSPRSGFMRVKAIIDTGSPETIIGYEEAMALQIPFSNVATEKFINLGGSKYAASTFNRLTMIFKDEEEKAVQESINVCVLKPTSDKQKMQGFSLLLGTDFLRERGYKLFCDMKNDLAYLEK